MTAQSEECDVYKPISCGGNQCPSCQGKGTCPCRFCHGVGFIHMQLPAAASVPQCRGEQVRLQHEENMWGGSLKSLLQVEASSSFLSCNICQQQGHETCKNCQGSGWIADWTNVDIRADLKP
jgi:DnaJ-class molecular chaperone